MNLYTVNLTFKRIMLLTQSNNSENSDIFNNRADTLHCTTGRLESNTSNDSATPTVSCTSLKPQIIFYNGQRNGRFVWLMLQIPRTWGSGRCNTLTPSHSFVMSQWVIFGYKCIVIEWVYDVNVRHDMCLTLSLLMSYIYGAPIKARNLTSYTYRRDFYLGMCLLNGAFC
jgi:hypothetical protein